MSLNPIDKYVSKKKRDLLEYAKILESMITIDDNKLWNNKKEFIKYAVDVIDYYVDNYYFDNNSNRDNPVLYSNDNINYVLKSIIEIFKRNNTANLVKERKNETFLLSVIICTSCYLDFATNVVDGNFNDTKSKFKYLLDYFRKTNILNVSSSKYWVNDLFDLIKKNNSLDNKFLDSFKLDNICNEYNRYNNMYYTFKFKYRIDELTDMDEGLVNKVISKYNAKFNEMSYDLLFVHILKEYISNDEMGIALITADSTLNKKNNLVSLFDNKYIKPMVKLLVPFEEESTYLNLIKRFKEIGIETIYEYNNVDNISEKLFNYDMKIMVKNEFIKNNEDNKLSWDKKGIEFIIKED